MMEEKKLNEQQLSEASGGKDPHYNPPETGKCRRCGKKAILVYLATHGGLCKACVAKESAPKCPACGGEMKDVPSEIHEQTVVEQGSGQFTLKCVDCGHTMTVDLNQ